MRLVSFALVGDFNSAVVAHQCIPRALELAGKELGVMCEAVWAPTMSLDTGEDGKLAGFNAIWCIPASPYACTRGALNAIRYAREQRIPFLGTCGGFQHALMEYAANVLHIASQHAEIAPDADDPLITMLSCSLVEKNGGIIFAKGSRLRAIYGVERAEEGYHCRFGLNAKYEKQFQDAGMRITARDESGEARGMELEDHPFFIGTLFQPERSALKGQVHPLIRAYVRAAAKI